MEFTATETTKSRMLGLSHGDSNPGYADIDYALYPSSTGALYVYEKGVSKGQFGTYASGDKLRVAVEGGQVKYRRNGTLLYASASAPQYPLSADTSFFHPSATVTNATIAAQSTTDIRWVVADHLGTARMTVDRTGSLTGVSRHDYLPFGEEIGVGVGGRTTNQGYSQPDGVRQKFTGQEHDNETGLDYFGARYYSSLAGRFTSVDPLDPVAGRQGAGFSATAEKQFMAYLGQPQNWNRYAYSLNNPLKYSDPTGEAPTIAVRMNIVWEKQTSDNNGQGFANEEEAREAAQPYIDYLKKAYGALDIEFDISFTEGTASRPNSPDESRIDPEKKVEGALNVFLTSRHAKAMGAAWSRENGDIFLNVKANGHSRLAHEVAHPLGLSAWSTGHNLTYFGAEWDIDTSLPRMHSGNLQEGKDWVDDYRTAKTKDIIMRRSVGPKYIERPRKPTTYDVLRVGARRFASK